MARLPTPFDRKSQMTNQAGTVTYARNYDPYGIVTYTGGTSSTAYGFTGEQYSAETQMLYLRARYYNPADGRFLSRDTWGGDVKRPLSFNKWNYVEGNPINKIDASGYFSTYCSPTSENSRNLTGWLVREMAAQSNDWPISPGIDTLIASSNLFLNQAASQLATAVWEKLSNGSELTEDEKAWVARELVIGGGLRIVGFVWWAEMVKDGARWDFKDQILSRMGESMMLCDYEECDWYEYSTAGNIFYAYVGRGAGFTEAELLAGAVYAQQTDPENNPWTNGWPWSPFGLDQATDQAAITLGFQVYNSTRGSSDSQTVMNSFKIMLKQYKSGLDHTATPIKEYITSFPIGPDGPEFPLRYFDGTNFIGFFGR